LFSAFRQAKVKDLDTYAFELLNFPENLAKKDLLLRIVYGKVDEENYFQHQFELHWPLKENIPAKYEYLEQHILSNLTKFLVEKLHYKNVQKQTLKLTFARYFPNQAEWMIINSGTKNNDNKKPKPSNLRLDPYRLTDLVVIGVLEGENLRINDFETEYDEKQRKQIQKDKTLKQTHSDSGPTSSAKIRRRSPQNTMRIDVDDFEN